MIDRRRQCVSLTRALLTLVGCIGMIGGGVATPTPAAAYTFEEYIVEHEVSAVEAKNASLAIDLNAIHPPFGCQKCTTEEIRYCESQNFVSDHCCCDRRFHEELPYIPHTCYFGRKLCRPIAGHCDDYTKIRKCCCDKHALALCYQIFSRSTFSYNGRLAGTDLSDMKLPSVYVFREDSSISENMVVVQASRRLFEDVKVWSSVKNIYRYKSCRKSQKADSKKQGLPVTVLEALDMFF